MTTAGHRGGAMRWFDRAAAAILLLGVIDFSVYAVTRGHSPAGGITATIGAAALLALCALALLVPPRTRAGTLALRAARVIVLAALVGGVKLEYDRMPRKVVLPDARHENHLTDAGLANLSPDFQLKWALRVAAQSISAVGHVDSLVTVPSSWPYPPNIRLDVVDAGDSVVLTAVGRDATRACRFILFVRYSQTTPLAGRHDPVPCGLTSVLAPHGARELAVRRAPLPAAKVVASAPRADEWPEYRRAADRDGADRTVVRGSPVTWRAIADGEVRATPSITDRKVLVGTHGAGALHAFDLRSGRLLWMHYVPNWIHQDAVSDGHTVLVGFGDTQFSQYAWTPAGVSAFSLETGALLWSVFEGNAVMTSPVIWQQRAVYITSAGVLKMLDLATGAEVARLRLPGRAVMASPALSGDTLVAVLDDAENVCALQLDPVSILWCTPLPRGGMGGTSALTVVDGRVFASAAILQGRGPFGLSAGRWHDLKYALGWMRPTDFTFVGERVWALDLATGHVDWQSSIYPAVRNPGGNISGTPVIEKGNATTLLPLSGTMVALDVSTGRQRWTQETGPSRGPAAYGDGHLYLTLRNGELRMVNVETGKTECSIPTPAGFDRVGPALADSSFVFGSLSGVVYAMPEAVLRSCDKRAAQVLVR